MRERTIEDLAHSRRRYPLDTIADFCKRWGELSGTIGPSASVNGLVCLISGAWRKLRHPEEYPELDGWSEESDYSRRETALADLAILCLMLLRELGREKLDIYRLILRRMAYLERRRKRKASGNK